MPEESQLTALAITEVQEKLEQDDLSGAEIVKLRYFAGLSIGAAAPARRSEPWGVGATVAE